MKIKKIATLAALAAAAAMLTAPVAQARNGHRGGGWSDREYRQHDRGRGHQGWGRGHRTYDYRGEGYYRRDGYYRDSRGRRFPWAPPAGVRHKYRYHYYRGAQVYYDPARHIWFWLAAGIWHHGAWLPGNIRVYRSNRVFVDMLTPQPWRHHRQIYRWHPGRHFRR